MNKLLSRSLKLAVASNSSCFLVAKRRNRYRYDPPVPVYHFRELTHKILQNHSLFKTFALVVNALARAHVCVCLRFCVSIVVSIKRK